MHLSQLRPFRLKSLCASFSLLSLLRKKEGRLAGAWGATFSAQTYYGWTIDKHTRCESVGPYLFKLQSPLLSPTIGKVNLPRFVAQSYQRRIIDLKTARSSTFLRGNLIRNDLNVHMVSTYTRFSIPIDEIAQTYLFATLSDEPIRRDTLGY